MRRSRTTVALLGNCARRKRRSRSILAYLSGGIFSFLRMTRLGEKAVSSISVSKGRPRSLSSGEHSDLTHCGPAPLSVPYTGRSSTVVALDFSPARSLAYFSSHAVLYFSRYAVSTASLKRLFFMGTARTATSTFPTWIAPRDSLRNVLYQPFGLTLHDRAMMRFPASTNQIPIKRCLPVPALTRILLLFFKTVRRSSETALFGFIQNQRFRGSDYLNPWMVGVKSRSHSSSRTL